MFRSEKEGQEIHSAAVGVVSGVVIRLNMEEVGKDGDGE